MNPQELRQKFYNLATSKTPWYKIVNQTDGPTQIHIFNSIGGFGISADDFIGELNNVSGPVELRINSEGGEVFQAKAIYNALCALPDVAVVVDGLAASAAAFVAMSASPGKLFMSKIATMMIHDGHVMAAGSAADLRSLANVLDKESDTIAGIFADRTGGTAAYFREKMQAETWYNAEQALEEKLCDGIFDTRTGKVFNQVRMAAAVPYVSDRQTRHEPMTGSHRHDHAAYEADDHDDGVHFHLHEHSNDALHDHADQHAHPHEPGMGGEDDSGASYGRFAGSTDIVLAASFPESVFYNRSFTREQRTKLAKSGAARSDGSYPIETCQDAMNARRAYGRSQESERSAVASHIRKREKALGGCGRDPFSPGSGDGDDGSANDKFDLIITDEDIARFSNSSLKALKGA